MVIKDVVQATKLALENMNKDYCKLSKIKYEQIKASPTTIKYIKEEKYLERPFAYEFYHQLRELMDKRIVNFGEPIIQAEVDKKYQKYFEKGKIPDFIIHLPNSKKNLAVIEFKLATRKSEDIKKDIEKLIEFKIRQLLKYENGIEVILGPNQALEVLRADIKNWNKIEGEEIIIVEFNTDTWKAEHSIIKFNE